MKFLKSFGTYLTSAVMAASLVLAPVAFAQDNNNGKGNDKRDAKQAKHEVKTSEKSRSTLNLSIAGDNDVRISVNNDSVDVRGATVTAVSGNTITATTKWNNLTLTWVIVTDGSTQFTNKNGIKNSLATVKVGDRINFSGKANLTASSFADLRFSVNAKAVKDLSASTTLLTERHVFEGKLKAMLDSTLPGSFTLTIGNNVYTVLAATGTPILNALWATSTLDRFSVGDTVRVFGSVQIGSDNVIEAYVIRDASLR